MARLYAAAAAGGVGSQGGEDDFVEFVTDVLEYCVLDLSGHGTAHYKELGGVRLLPCASEQVLCFPYAAFVATAAEQALLPPLRESFVHHRCSDRLAQVWRSFPDAACPSL